MCLTWLYVLAILFVVQEVQCRRFRRPVVPDQLLVGRVRVGSVRVVPRIKLRVMNEHVVLKYLHTDCFCSNLQQLYKLQHT